MTSPWRTASAPPQPVEARNTRCKCVAGHANDDEAQSERAQIVVMFEFAIDGDEDVKPALGKGEERAVSTASPADFGHSRNRVSRKCGTHTGVHTVV